jgi:ubiquinone/menaquinone biosynthesis C-methylase UbiE
MNWKAAEEAESATLSIAAGYWENVDPYTAQDWMRYNISENIKNYFSSVQGDKKGFPNKVLDMGCSTGISTCFLKKTLPVGTEVNGVDLSPYFIAVADYYSDDFNLGIQYYHENAECTHFKDKSFDFVISNFLFHELPEKAAKNIIEESYRLLNNNGVIAIVDIDPNNLKAQLSGNMFRKWAFEVTEPHIYNYYKRDTIKMLQEAGFVNIRKNSNDPLNSIWFGTKGKMENKKPTIQRKSYINRLNYNILGVM